MTVASEGTPLEQARDAAARGEWQQAHDLLIEADASTPLRGPDLALLADVAYAAGHLDVTIERVGDGRTRRACARAIGWRRRARRSASPCTCSSTPRSWPPFEGGSSGRSDSWRARTRRRSTPGSRWCAVTSGCCRATSESARRWARRAIEVGAKCDPAAAALGRVAEARSLILEGDVQQGLGLLNEAAVATVSGELDPLSTGIVYCELVCALQALAQYDLAEEWTDAMERWRHGQPVGSIHGRCRVHRAEILRLRGLYAEAEEEALLACEELRPYLRREFGWPLTELGRIRLAPGRHPGRGGGVPRGASRPGGTHSPALPWCSWPGARRRWRRHRSGRRSRIP